MLCLFKRKRIYSILAVGLILLILPTYAKSNYQQSEWIQLDLQGDSHFSRYNFTDIKIPYNGIDSWTELKLAYWMNNTKSFGPYLSIIPVFTTISEFWWQKNAQIAGGLQLYPFPQKNRYLRSVRFFALLAWRTYFDQPDDAKQEDKDIQIGADYYYDNLFENRKLIAIIWSNAGFRKTNFSLENYNTFLLMGNIKFGIKVQPNSSLLLGYFFTEWTYVPKYKERWWENFIRLGGGIRIYPKTDKTNNLLSDILKRFHVYVEVVNNVAWLGNQPYLKDMKRTDFRIGLGFSTGGFFKH